MKTWNEVPRVLHLDHTSTTGGAEYALMRMLRAEPSWRPLVLLPPGESDGVFGRLAGMVPIRSTGVRQAAGVSAAGVTAIIGATAALVVQAISTRLHPGFRTADIIDANTARSAAYGALAAYTSRVRFVVHLRDVVGPEALGAIGHAIMTRVILPRADGVVANSAATLAAAHPHLRNDVVAAVIPSASGLRPVRPSPNPSTGPLQIGMLARIDPWKGQELLLDAFAEAFPHGDERLVLAGGAPFGHERFLAELRRKAVVLGVSARVDFLGHVDDVDKLLGGWDIAVQASQRPEPLGQNVLQYLAAGRTVVVADEGGPIEWVRDGVNGLRIAPRDTAALSSALRRLADSPALRAALSRGAAETQGLLSDREVASAHAEFYAEVLGRRPTAARG